MFNAVVISHWKGYIAKYQAITATAFYMDSRRTNFIYSGQEKRILQELSHNIVLVQMNFIYEVEALSRKKLQEITKHEHQRSADKSESVTAPWL